MARTLKKQLGHAPQTALLLGAGYSAAALITPLKEKGYHVITTSRSQARLDRLKALGAEAIIYAGTPSDEFKSSLKKATVLLSSIPPQKSDPHSGRMCDPFLQHMGLQLTQYTPQLRWAGYLSATSVYGDRDGQWAYEDELLRPQTQRGRNRVEAELEWLETGLPVHIFRLAGIYGGEIAGQSRNPFQRLKNGTARAVIKPGHIVNRIHVEDIARAVLASIDRPTPTQIYNLADDLPAPPQDVLNFAADIINVSRPPRVNHDTADISDMARSFYSETKRVSNAKAKTLLAWEPIYPDYKTGLRAIFMEEQEAKP